MNDARPEIFAWRPRRNTSGTAPTGAGAYWFLNLGNQPIWGWRPRTHAVTTGGGTGARGKWFTNFGNMPIWRWNGQPGEIPADAIAFTVQGVGTASFVGTIPQRGAFTISGRGTAHFTPRGSPVEGDFTCSGVGSVQFLVGLDAVIYTCLSGGERPSVRSRYPNFVY